jgi:hypothetical protein
MKKLEGSEDEVKEKFQVLLSNLKENISDNKVKSIFGLKSSNGRLDSTVFKCSICQEKGHYFIYCNKVQKCIFKEGIRLKNVVKEKKENLK